MNIRAGIKHLFRYLVAPEDVRVRRKNRQRNEAARDAVRRPQTEARALAKNYLAGVRAAALRDTTLAQEARREAYNVDRATYLAARGRVARLANMTHWRMDREPVSVELFISAFRAEIVKLLAYESRFRDDDAGWHMDERASQ